MSDLEIPKIRFPDQSEVVNGLGAKRTPDKPMIDEHKILKDNKDLQEEIKRIEKENELEKEKIELLKKSMISEQDLRVLLLMYGSKGNTKLLEDTIAEMKKLKKGQKI